MPHYIHDKDYAFPLNHNDTSIGLDSGARSAQNAVKSSRSLQRRDPLCVQYKNVVTSVGLDAAPDFRAMQSCADVIRFRDRARARNEGAKMDGSYQQARANQRRDGAKTCSPPQLPAPATKYLAHPAGVVYAKKLDALAEWEADKVWAASDESELEMAENKKEKIRWLKLKCGQVWARIKIGKT
jgi:hypothetical protein